MTDTKRNYLEEAFHAFYKGRSHESLALLKNAGESTEDGSIAMLKGLIYEFGANELEIDLPAALHHYRHAAVLSPDVVPPYLHMARVLMKSHANSDSIKHWLDTAAAIRNDADVSLAFAAYYEEVGDIDLRKARVCFRRAALSGRYAGFFGVARILRMQGKCGSAMAVDLLRVLLAPFLLLLIGRKVTANFNGYWR